MRKKHRQAIIQKNRRNPLTKAHNNDRITLAEKQQTIIYRGVEQLVSSSGS